MINIPIKYQKMPSNIAFQELFIDLNIDKKLEQM